MSAILLAMIAALAPLPGKWDGTWDLRCPASIDHNAVCQFALWLLYYSSELTCCVMRIARMQPAILLLQPRGTCYKLACPFTKEQ